MVAEVWVILSLTWTTVQNYETHMSFIFSSVLHSYLSWICGDFSFVFIHCLAMTLLCHGFCFVVLVYLTLHLIWQHPIDHIICIILMKKRKKKTIVTKNTYNSIYRLCKSVTKAFFYKVYIYCFLILNKDQKHIFLSQVNLWQTVSLV